MAACSPAVWIRSPAALAALAALAVFRPGAARAAFGDPEVRLDVGAGYDSYQASRRYHGIGGAAALQYVFDSTWAALARYGLSEHNVRGAAFEVHQLGAAARYRLDVFEYVPYLELAPTAYLTTGDGGPKSRATGGLRTGLGFDRLVGDRVTLGCGVHYHRLLGEDVYPSFIEVHLTVGFRFALGDGLAP